jgi:translation elongation factor P/translation initiation factor 5A
MMNGHPCKIIELSTVTTGKHGSARVGIVGNDIFTSKRYEESRPISGTVEVPIVSKKEYEVAEIN